MAELTQDVMFHDGDIEGCSSKQIAAFNYELMNRLGNLEPGSREYLALAKKFHLEVARRDIFP